MTHEPGLVDGSHRIDCAALPLPAMHPLRHGRLAVDLVVESGIIRSCAFDAAAGHRGDERLLEVRDFRQGLALVCRHAWLTAPFAETVYARALERALGITPSQRAEALRQLAMALNAVAVEALWQFLDSGSPNELLRREQALHALELLTGGRMHTTFTRIGGVANDVTAEDLNTCAALIDASASGRALAQRIADLDDAAGPTQQQLPKTLRLPKGEYFETINTPHGDMSVWVVGAADKVPHRVRIINAAQRRLAALEQEAPGMTVAEFSKHLAGLRFVPTEVSR